MNALFDLTNNVAVITGASRGLGQYFARALAKSGADLVLTARNVNDLTDIVAEISKLGVQVLALPLDVNNQNSINHMVDEAIAYYGKIDILVNNAGCNIRKPALEVSWDDWESVSYTHLTLPTNREV